MIESFSEFKDDKFIDRVTLMAILEEVFRSALKRKFGSDDILTSSLTPTRGTSKSGGTAWWYRMGK